MKNFWGTLHVVLEERVISGLHLVLIRILLKVTDLKALCEVLFRWSYKSGKGQEINVVFAERISVVGDLEQVVKNFIVWLERLGKRLFVDLSCRLAI